ncbi:hypothetical protein DIPPA_14281 [Diplonema papillatum]|nr:hypothetical protein DIPPA_14281 [Diplonema papillatum]
MLDLSPLSEEFNDKSGSFARGPSRAAEARLIENRHEHPDLQPFSRIELHALAFPQDSNFAFLIEDEIQEFQASPQTGLRFPPMTPFHRRLVSDCALRYGLESISMGKGDDRYIVTLKTDAKTVVPMLQYHHALPTNMMKEKLHLALGYKRKKCPPSTGYSSINGQIIDCKQLTNNENFKPYHPSKQQDYDRSDWMRLVYDTVRKGLPVATHAHIVEVRIANPKQEVGQFQELQKFLGPFHVRWLDDDRSTGIGVVVYPSVPSASNCLDRFEDEDDEGGLPFRLYPFAPHVFGPYIDEQAIRRYKADGNGSSTPIGRSPSSTGGSWRDGAGQSYLEWHMSRRSGGVNQTPPLAPREQHGSPPLHPGKGSRSPHGLSPGMAPSRGSPGMTVGSAPTVQPFSLGRGKWLETKRAGPKGADSSAKHTVEVVLSGDKQSQASHLMDCYAPLEVLSHSRCDSRLFVDFSSQSDAKTAVQLAVDNGMTAKIAGTTTGGDFVLDCDTAGK